MTNPPKVVFVYIGNSLPDYVIANIATSCRQFDLLKFVLVTDQEVLDFDLPNLEIFYLNKELMLWKNVENTIVHPKEFRNGFWFLTLARFKALQIYAKNHPNQSFIHIESDVKLLPSFPFNEFNLINDDLAFATESSTHGAAAVLFFKNVNAVDKLVQVSERLVLENPNHTDMTILGHILRKGIISVTLLPSYPHQPGASDIFKSFLFDPTTWGMFFLGIDSRNHRGKRIFGTIPDNHDLELSAVEIEVTDGKVVISCPFCRREWNLANLHIHSKDLKLLSTQDSSKYLDYRVKKSLTGPYSEVEIKVLRFLIWSKIVKLVTHFLRPGPR